MRLLKVQLPMVLIILMAAWTAASAEPCDPLLVRQAALSGSRRAQLAGAQLITQEMFDGFRTGAGGGLRLLDRQIEAFDNFQQFDSWRTEAASSFFFEYGLDSARAIVLASADDAFFSSWDQCQEVDAQKQSPPLLRGWVHKLLPDQAVVRLVLSVNPSVSTPQIQVDRSSPLAILEDREVPLSRQPGRLVVERQVRVSRGLKSDLRLAASGEGLMAYVVVPGAPMDGLSAPPRDATGPGGSRLIRELTGFRMFVEKGNQVKCLDAVPGTQFDLGTISVNTNSYDGYWNVTVKTPQTICVSAGAPEKRIDPFNLRVPTPFALDLRVQQIRARAE